MTWRVPLLWPDAIVAVLASGPSMSQSVADAVKGIPTIAINNTYELAPWSQVLYAADAGWWDKHPAAHRFAGLKVSIGKVPGVHCLRNTGVDGFDPDSSCIRTGGNSGYQGIQVAAHAGAKRILLCGFDMSGGHWHPEHIEPLRRTHQDVYAIWARRFESLAVALEARGVEVVNCSPESALRCFRKQSLDEALAFAGRLAIVV